MNKLKVIWKALAAAGAAAEQDSEEILRNFTPRAQQALAFAHKEADRFNHNFVGTEHLLLGLIRLGQGVAVNVLRKMGVDLETARAEVEKSIGRGADQKIFGTIPYTPRVKKVLGLATMEAKALNHTYVGTEHLLLGLLREGNGVAGQVLQGLEVDVEKTRREILKELDPNFTATDVGTELSAANSTSMLPKSKLSPNAEPLKPLRDSIDTSKRYDVYCTERDQEVVVYRNALFKGTKALHPQNRCDTLAQFMELEQADGQTIFVALYSVIKFCESGVVPNPEIVPGEKP